MDYFGTDSDGQKIMHWDLQCDRDDGVAGAIMRVSAYGAAILNLWVYPTETETNAGIYDYVDLVLGWENLKEYEKNDPHFGVVVGRVAGRINHAKIEIDGKQYNLEKTDGKDYCLHGGKKSCSHKKWELRKYDKNYIKLEHKSSTSLDGFPGDLTLSIEYTLNYDQSKKTADVLIQYTGKIENSKCPINPTQHTYWNIAGHEMGSEAIKRQKVKINASKILELDSNLVPTGSTIELNGHVKNLQSEKALKEVIEADGYDNYYIFDHEMKAEDVKAAKGEPQIYVVDEKSKRSLKCWTDQLGVQFYTGQFIGPDLDPAKHKKKYEKNGGLCLETQGYPDSLNNSNFPSCLKKPGEQNYTQTTLYRITNLN